MAARLNPKHDQRTREKIQTSQLINRLQSHVNGEVELTNSQVRAAEVLLKKTIPDLATLKHEGNEDSPVKVEHVFSWLGQNKG